MAALRSGYAGGRLLSHHGLDGQCRGSSSSADEGALSGRTCARILRRARTLEDDVKNRSRVGENDVLTMEGVLLADLPESVDEVTGFAEFSLQRK